MFNLNCHEETIKGTVEACMLHNWGEHMKSSAVHPHFDMD